MWITDPPYPFNNRNGTNRFLYEDGTDGFYKRMSWDDLSDCFGKMFELSNSGSRAYVFSNKDGMFETKSRMEKSGWTFRNILVWDKKRMGMGYHWRHKAEYILYFSKAFSHPYSVPFTQENSNFSELKYPSMNPSISPLFQYVC